MANNFKNIEEPRKEKKVKSTKMMRGISNVISGEFLMKDFTVKNLPFLFFLSLLMIVYIGWQFNAERTLKEINKVEKDIKDLKMRNVSVKDELTEKSLQSKVAGEVESLGLKESMDPPKIIKEK